MKIHQMIAITGSGSVRGRTEGMIVSVIP